MSGNRVTARATVGAEIRRARETRRMSRAQLAERIFVSESLVAKWESGKQAIKPEYMKRLIEVLQISPDDMVRILGELVNSDISPEWTDKWLTIEGNANEVLSFDLSAVPGLLQNEEYARAVLQYNRHAPIDIEEQIRSRLDRQQILSKEDPPTTVFIIDEYVLHRRVGSHKVMFDQLMQLCELAKRPDIFLHVVPSDTEYYAGCPFMIAKVDGIEFAFQDGAWNGQVLEDQEEVSALSRIWQGIRAAALPQDATINRIAAAAQAWDAK
jgi:transcriptional regulator with XRE-family HTH domain